MILDAADSAGTLATLDDLFRRAGVRRPQAVALIDPPNRAQFTDGSPRQLTYAQADRAISAIAARLRALELGTDAVVALQLPNTVESVLALLGVLRAGMIAAPLPLLWRRADATVALRNSGAKAIVTCARIGAAAQAEIAAQVAAEVFSIRHVCAFGAQLPDGIAPLDTIFSAAADGTGAMARLANPAAHIAVITFDIAADGIVPMARNHRQLIAGALGPYMESGLGDDAAILSAIPASSFAGFALTLLPLLLSGGTLELHHSFDAGTFAAQAQARHDLVVLPAAALPRLTEANLLDTAQSVLALWRAPERMQRSERCRARSSIVDVASFGAVGLIAARRSGEHPAPLPFGAILTRAAANNIVLIETARSATGTLMLRGAMVPRSGFPFGAKPRAAMTEPGFIDTGYACRFTADGQALVVTAPPAGIASIGGYRFVTRALDGLADSLEADATLVVLPQELTGERLAGHARDPAVIHQELERRGVNPLIVGAFRQPQAA
jgi:non-ribosomal peptide synthetase component E (peptide arylation enzyme)